jgi:hypothetical protein
MVGVIGDPDGHFFSAFEHRALYEQGFEFDRPEFAIVGPDRFFSEITDIEGIDLPVEEHVERDSIAGFVAAEIDITRIKNSAEDILDTVRHFVYAGAGDRRVGFLDKSDIFFCLIAALVDVADELIRLEGQGIDIGFVFVADPEKLVFKTIGFPLPYYVIYVFVVEAFERRGKAGFAGGETEVGQPIVYFVGQYFAGFESGIAEARAKGGVCLNVGIL